jgi:hypothetical protein
MELAMKSLRPMLLAAMSLGLTGTVWAASDCQHAYEKFFPYDLPMGNAEAYINVHSEVRLSYDCQTAQAFAGAEARAGIFDLDLNLLQAEAKAEARMGETFWSWVLKWPARISILIRWWTSRLVPSPKSMCPGL